MSCGCRRSSCGLGRTAICGRAGASARTGPASPPSRPINPCTARRRRRRRPCLASGSRTESRAPPDQRRRGGHPPGLRAPGAGWRTLLFPCVAPSRWHTHTHTSPAVLCFRSRWPAGPGSIDAAGVALSRKGAKSRTGGRKLVMLMARPIPRADLKKQESRWACRRSGSSHVSVGLTGLLNPT
jgi:hypothetical protein